MSREIHEIYEFGPFRLDVGEHIFERKDDAPNASLPEKAFQTLVYLVRNHGTLVSKGELLDAIWPDAIVEENNLDKCIHHIRHVLNDRRGEQIYVETVRKHGYRFIAEVRRVAPNGQSKDLALSEDTSGTREQYRAERREDQSSDLLSAGNSAVHEPAATNGSLPARIDALDNESRTASVTSEILSEDAAPRLPLPASSSRPFHKHRLVGVLALSAIVIVTLGWGYYILSEQRGDNRRIFMAVLPFRPIDSANRNDIYELGMAESLINRLSVTEGLAVRPLHTTRKYVDVTQDPLEAGKEQKVDFVLASNYQMADGRIRVTAQLYDVSNGNIQETYAVESKDSDLFAMQDVIAGSLAGKILSRFSLHKGKYESKRGTTHEEAYRLYLQGSSMTARRTAADAAKAIETFEEAILLDPNYARAYAGLAAAYTASGTLRAGEPREEFEKAKAAVAKALELDGDLADAYAVRADLKHKYDWDRKGAEEDFLRAIELEPNNVRANDSFATLLITGGRFDEGFQQLEKALTLNPRSLALQRDVGRFAYFARRYDEAIAQLKRVIEVDDKFQTAYGWLWFALDIKGDHAGAYEWFIEHQKLADPESVETFRKAYEEGGWTAVKRKKLETDKQSAHELKTNLWGIARLCALSGEKEEAFDFINKAIERRQSQVIMLKVDPAFDPIRDDPRFEEALRRVGY